MAGRTGSLTQRKVCVDVGDYQGTTSEVRMRLPILSLAIDRTPLPIIRRVTEQAFGVEAIPNAAWVEPALSAFLLANVLLTIGWGVAMLVTRVRAGALGRTGRT